MFFQFHKRSGISYNEYFSIFELAEARTHYMSKNCVSLSNYRTASIVVFELIIFFQFHKRSGISYNEYFISIFELAEARTHYMSKN